MWKNNGKLRLCIVVGTRPEVIRLSRVIEKCRACFDTLLIHTGQNYDRTLNGVFFEELRIDPPEITLDAAVGGLGETMGAIIARSYACFEELRPDALLILGDTNSCLCAISAKRLHIPIFHMEAGNRCKDERLPEETNRRIVDIISDVNMPYSEHARRYLIECGLPMERTFVTGSPMPEVLTRELDAIKSCDILTRLGLQRRGYFLLSIHREENIDDGGAFLSVFTAVNELAKKYGLPVLYSCHPRSAKRLDETGFELDRRVIRHEPLGFHDYNALQVNALAVISDSGTLPEESAFYAANAMAFPAVSVRTSTERPEAMEKGCFVISGTDTQGLLQSVELAVSAVENGDIPAPVPDYTDLNVSGRVVKIIQSYTAIVNRTVWRKE